MKIKTFPLQFTEERLDEIRAAAERAGKPIYQFIIDSVDKEMRAGDTIGRTPDVCENHNRQ